MNAQLRTDLKRLNLSGLLSTLEVRLLEANANQLSPLEFLELLVSDEMTARQDRAIARRVKEAGFREIKRLEDFDFSFNPSIPKKRLFDLATGATSCAKSAMCSSADLPEWESPILSRRWDTSMPAWA